MSIWAIIPVKPFTEGKSRLRDYFSADQLCKINRNFFLRTLKTIGDCPNIKQILVISRDEAVLAETEKLGHLSLLEREPYSLNQGISQALSHLNGVNHLKALILPTDLPLMKVEDLHLLFTNDGQEPSITLVPDRIQSGTNAVFLNKIKGFTPQYGRNSFQKHAKQALQLCGKLDVKLIKNIQHDLDTFIDLELLDESIINQLDLNKRKEIKND